MNSEKDLKTLNKTGNIISRFLAESRYSYNFSLFNEGDYGLENIYTILLSDEITKINIIANTEGTIYFEVVKFKNDKKL